MKILHTADLHLFSPLSANFDMEKAAIRNNELLNTFKRMVDFAKEETVRAFLISGDLFDSSFISSNEQQFVFDLIRSAPDISFFYLRGNHDENVFSSMVPDNLTMFRDGFSFVEIDDIFIGGADNASVNKAVFPSGKKSILMLHGDIKNEINLGDLKGRGISYVALGHIHSFSEGRIDFQTKYAYPGCPDPRGYDECGEKGFILLNTEFSEVKTQFIPFASRVAENVFLDISGASSNFDVISKADELLKNKSSDMMIKLCLSGDISPECNLNTNLIAENFENGFFDFKVSDLTKVSFDIEQYRYDDTLKGEFIRTVLSSDEYSDNDKSEILKIGIAALNGEALI